MRNIKESGKSSKRHQIVALIMALVLVLASCGTAKETTKKKRTSGNKKSTSTGTEITPTPEPTQWDEGFLAKLKSIDGIMLTIGVENLGPYDWGNDEVRDSYFELHYDGTMIRTTYHSESDPEEQSVVIPDRDLVDFYLFCVEYEDGSAFAGHHEDVCDGSMLYFTYYDESGTRHNIFGGYCYQLDVLQDIENRACSYFYPDLSISCRAFLSMYPDLLDTITNLCSAEIEKIDTLPDDICMNPGFEEYSYDFFYSYTYTTTEDAEKGPVVLYVSRYGNLLAMKNNRNWDRDDLLIEVNGTKLTATLAYEAHGWELYAMLMNGPLTIEMKADPDFEYGEDLILGETPEVFTIAEPDTYEGFAGDIITFHWTNKIAILTEETDMEHHLIGRINSVTEEELREILGDGDYTVVLSLPEVTQE
ncbi:MAG: hypothetical protein IKZ74_01940 [Clostridiales bacterium]|nr:hypothetical protein [Clostridiales bacterium]